MTTTAMKKKITDYLETADNKKVRAMYAMIEDEVGTGNNDWDEEFFEELERRSKSFEDGTAKMYTWEETQKAAMDSINEIRKRK